ncbi:uncharacterized protein LOC130703562 [Daphnia carinata]|uniref:uncharacterized protein LOC130703562 n=1 Tax=Daphnia carinata TaxID=120202 RepID=UPI002579C964|nr:uncharacterized protein LOC130703562 [Daphnia carinata]
MEIERDVVYKQLESEDKSTRRAALLDLKKRAEKRQIDKQLQSDLFDPLIKIVSSDKVDSLRESASLVLHAITTHGSISNTQFHDIVNVSVDRFEVEPSEEIRLTLARMNLAAILNQNGQPVYLENLDKLTQLVKLMVRDRFGEVVKEACEIIVALSERNEYFRLQADYFVEPLMQNVKSQPMKVRLMCVKALEPVMIYSPLTIPNIAPQLEMFWSESSPIVKLAMVHTIGKVSLAIEPDDQNFHFLFPLILLGRCNEFNEVSEEAERMWGTLTNQPEFHRRFEKCFSKLISKLLADTENWNNDLRIQSAQLIYQFVREIPDRKLELSTIMEILIFQSGDDQASVRNWACKSARLIGETCALEALSWLSDQKQEEIDVTGTSGLTIYSHIVHGFLNAVQSDYPARTLELCVQLAIKFSSLKDISLLECLETLVEKDLGISVDLMNQLLSVALSLEGSDQPDFLARKMSMLQLVASRLCYSNINAMVQQKLPSVLASEADPLKWTITSSSWKILQFIARDMKMIDNFVFDLLCQTIAATQCPEIKLKSFNMLTGSMDHVQCTDPAQFQAMLLANVKWKPGRSASVLRSSAALCAYAAVQHHKLEIIPSNIDVIANSFVDLVEDEAINTRLAAIRIIQRCLIAGRPANLDSILTTLMGRLNDISKDVRQGAMTGLRDVFIHWRGQGAPCAMETKFINLVRVLARDDDLPSKTFADGVLQSMLVDLSKMDITGEKGSEVE